MSELFKSRETAPLVRHYSNAVLIGASNVARSGRHMSNAVSTEVMAVPACARTHVRHHCPALLPAAFRLNVYGVSDLPTAWTRISSIAADAAGLPDQGRINMGLQADILLVRTPTGQHVQQQETNGQSNSARQHLCLPRRGGLVAEPLPHH